MDAFSASGQIQNQKWGGREKGKEEEEGGVDDPPPHQIETHDRITSITDVLFSSFYIEPGYIKVWPKSERRLG